MTDRVALGKIGKAHGVQGAFRVWPYADDLERFAALKRVTLSRGARTAAANVLSVQIAAGFVILRTDAVQTPEDVQIWLGGDVEIEAAERVALPEGRYFHDQILGLTVVTPDGRAVGAIVEIIDGTANDIYVCRDGDREFMIPAVDVFIKSIDLKTRRMVIDPIPGLLD
ncbi:MAG TPA: ribosome maturation factor RimM [bacterium]|nr:ribosome maturation factor RimM [bacterium]